MGKLARSTDALEGGLYLLFLRVGSLFEAGSASFLGPDWQAVLKDIRQENFGLIGNGIPIQIHKLHRNDKIKSGFVGVYPNGQGFRAAGKKPNSRQEHHIGTFDTAEEAAWRRYLYYKENKIPYGPMEIEIERLRAMGYKGTDEELEANVHDYDKSVGMRTVAPGEEDEAAGWDPNDPHGHKHLDELEASDPVYAAKAAEIRERMRVKRLTADDVPLAGFENGVPPEIDAALRKAR